MSTDFSQRGNVPSCSALPRLVNCPGSWALSKGLPDETSEAAERGTRIHSVIHHLATNKSGELDVSAEEMLLGATYWKHCVETAEKFFGTGDLVWRSEERLWYTDKDLNPILSGQADLICSSETADRPDGFPPKFILFDIKSGYQAGDVPAAKLNHQMQGMAAILLANEECNVWGSVVREWAAEEPQFLGDNYAIDLATRYANGEYDDPYKAGIKVGSWCQFCPAKKNGVCPAYKASLALVDNKVENLTQVEGKDLHGLLIASKRAESYIEAIENEARRRRAEGIEVPGVQWKAGAVKRNITDTDGLMKAMGEEGIAVSAKMSVSLSDAESAWLKKNGLKSNKDGKDAFSKKFNAYLGFTPNKESMELE